MVSPGSWPVQVPWIGTEGAQWPLSATAGTEWDAPAQHRSQSSAQTALRAKCQGPTALLVGKVREVCPAEAGVASQCGSGAERENTSEVFPREKTAVLIIWNNHLKLPNEGRRIKSAHTGGKKQLYEFRSTAQCWFTVIPFISFLIKQLLKDQACQCDLRPIAWSVKWGKLPDLLVMIESFWKEIENQYLSSLCSALYSEGQFVSVICMSVVGAYKVTVPVMQSEMTEYKI